MPPIGNPSNPSPYPSGNTDMKVARPSLRRITRSRALYAASSTVSRCHAVPFGDGMAAATSVAAETLSRASDSLMLAVELVDRNSGQKERSVISQDAALQRVRKSNPNTKIETSLVLDLRPLSCNRYVWLLFPGCSCRNLRCRADWLQHGQPGYNRNIS